MPDAKQHLKLTSNSCVGLLTMTCGTCAVYADARHIAENVVLLKSRAYGAKAAAAADPTAHAATE